jgi:adenylate cyclase
LIPPSYYNNMVNDRKILERFHSPEVVDFIINSGEDLTIPQERTATIVFSDIVGFTKLADKMTPIEVSQMLNKYFSAMTEIIFDYNGTLDKYIGDAIMAVFGAPIERQTDAERAIWAAIEMLNALPDVDDEIEIRIGINTGKVVAGSLGAHNRMEYTVLGDAVNVASRLEKMAWPGQILIGEGTYEYVKGKFEIASLGAKTIRGKDTRIMVYEVRR